MEGLGSVLCRAVSQIPSERDGLLHIDLVLFNILARLITFSKCILMRFLFAYYILTNAEFRKNPNAVSLVDFKY